MSPRLTAHARARARAEPWESGIPEAAWGRRGRLWLLELASVGRGGRCWVWGRLPGAWWQASCPGPGWPGSWLVEALRSHLGLRSRPGAGWAGLGSPVKWALTFLSPGWPPLVWRRGDGENVNLSLLPSSMSLFLCYSRRCCHPLPGILGFCEGIFVHSCSN